MSIIKSLPPTETMEQFKDQFYAELHNRTRAGMKQKAESGELPGCAPVGYLNVWKDGKKTIIVDPVKAPLIQEAFQLALEGNLSLRKIRIAVTEMGLTSRNGKSLGVSALWGIFTNPFYMGILRYNGELIQGAHQSLVDRKIFECVQKKLKSSR